MGGMMDFVMLGVMVLGGAFIWVNKDNLGCIFNPSSCGGGIDDPCITNPTGPGCGDDGGDSGNNPKLCSSKYGGKCTQECSGSCTTQTCKACIDACGTGKAPEKCGGVKPDCKGNHCCELCNAVNCTVWRANCGGTCSHCSGGGGTGGTNTNCSNFKCDTGNGYQPYKTSAGSCACKCTKSGGCTPPGMKPCTGGFVRGADGKCGCTKALKGCSSIWFTSSECTCVNCSSKCSSIGKVMDRVTSDGACQCKAKPPVPTANCFGYAACKGLTGATCCSCMAVHGGCKDPTHPKGICANAACTGCNCGTKTASSPIYGYDDGSGYENVAGFRAQAGSPGPYGDYRFANTGRAATNVRLAQ